MAGSLKYCIFRFRELATLSLSARPNSKSSAVRLVALWLWCHPGVKGDLASRSPRLVVPETVGALTKFRSAANYLLYASNRLVALGTFGQCSDVSKVAHRLTSFFPHRVFLCLQKVGSVASCPQMSVDILGTR